MSTVSRSAQDAAPESGGSLPIASPPKRAEPPPTTRQNADPIANGDTSSPTLHFLELLFSPTDIVLVRPIESWNEVGRTRSRALYRQFQYTTAGLISDAYVDRLNSLAEQTRANLFFGVCPRFGRYGYDLAWQVRTVRCLWADLDDCLPDAARTRCIEAELPEPSIVVSSGHGTHLYWLLVEPYLIDDVGDPPEVKTEWTDIQGKRKPLHYFDEQGERVWLDHQQSGRPLVANRPPLSAKALGLQDVVQGIASKIGGDHTHDLARLLRLPGTMNRKDQRNGREPVPCEIHSRTDNRDPFAAFERFAELSEGKHERVKIAQVRLREPQKLTATRQNKLNDLINRCALAPVGERSDADFALCCHAVEHGVDRADVWGQVSDVGKFAERGEAYFEQTWSKAEQQTREKIYHKAAKRSSQHVGNGKVTSSVHQSATTSLPDVTLPGGDIPITVAASTLGALLAPTGRYFRRGDTLALLCHEEHDEPILRTLKPAALPAAFESVATLFKQRATKEGVEVVPAICSEQTAKLIQNAPEFLNAIPPIRLVSPCPVLVEQNGELMQVVGYNRQAGVLAFGEPLPDVPLDEARELLRTVVADFRFATPSDRSRAFAALITPALVHGGVLGGRAPIDLGEANHSQTGKGYRNKLTAAVYRQHVSTVTQRNGGVGSLDESFNAKLVKGAGFISLDNIRGKVNSPAIESFLTEDRYSARVPYSPDVEIDTRRVVVMLTSNKAEMTTDLAYRSSCVRLLKQAEGYDFATHAEGDLVDHIRGNQPRYLAAVFAVIREWHRRGKPRTNETRHDFRPWAKILDWIVQELLGEAPLLDGHIEARDRMTNPALNWLRDVALAVSRANREADWLRTHEILNLLENTEIDIPGVNDDTNLDDEGSRQKILLSLGRKLSTCFGRKDVVEVDAFVIERQKSADVDGRPKNESRFTRRSPGSCDQPPNIHNRASLLLREDDASGSTCDVQSERVDPSGVVESRLGHQPVHSGQTQTKANGWKSTPQEDEQWTF